MGTININWWMIPELYWKPLDRMGDIWITIRRWKQKKARCLTRVMGKTAVQSEPWGRPEFGSAKDLTSWWTAALAMPYLVEKFNKTLFGNIVFPR